MRLVPFDAVRVPGLPDTTYLKPERWLSNLELRERIATTVGVQDYLWSESQPDDPDDPDHPQPLLPIAM